MNLHKNFIIKAALCCLLLGVVMLVSTSQVAAQNVITDLNLKKAINDAFTAQSLHGTRTDTTAVTALELGSTSFTRLDASGYGKANTAKIKSLAGLGNATSLTHLDLSHNALRDVATWNQVSGWTVTSSVLTELGSLTALQVLNLSSNSDSNFLSVGNNIQNDSIIDITPLQSLTGLRELLILNNNISDFSPLPQNSGLGSGDKVWLGGNNLPVRVEDVAGFYENIAVTLVNRGVTLYSTLGEIVQIPNGQFRRRLQYAVSGYLITGNDALARIVQRASDLGYTGNLHLPTTGDYLRNIISREPLTKELLAEVIALEIALGDEDTTAYIHLAGIKYCKNLKTLVIKDFEVDPQSYPEIAKLTNLTALEVDNDFYFVDSGDQTYETLAGEFDSAAVHLRGLTQLKWLKLTNLHMPDISVLDTLTNLEGLDLRWNRIDDIRPLKNFKKLRALYLQPQWGRNDFSWDPPPREFSYLYDLKRLRQLADDTNGIPHRWVTDTLIVKDYGLAEDSITAYTPGGYLPIEVIFHGKIGAKPNATGEKPYLLMSFPDRIERRAEWVLETYDADNDSTTVQFVHHLSAFDLPDEVIIDSLRMEVPDGSAVLNWLPSVIVNDGTRAVVSKMSVIPILGALPTREQELTPENITLADMLSGLPDEPYEIPKVHSEQFQFLVVLPLEGKPIIKTPPTVQMSRAGGETGTATGEKFDVEITFSGPLGGPSAAALANKISFEAVVGVTFGTATRPGVPKVYEPETWTLPVFVAAGASGDATVTLDPEGLRDLAFPDGNPIAAEGSTLSITVPVNRPAAPGESVTDADPVSVGTSLEFPIVFFEDGVTYEGTEKPYITIYVGEQEQANERHAVWAREEDVNSTRVTFEYQIGVGDIASEVSLKPEEGIAIPRGTTFVSETVRIVGTEPPASGPGVAPPPSTQPSGGAGPDPGQPAAGSPPITTAAERTRVSLTTAFARPTIIKRSVQILGVVYLPPEEESEPKSDASGVPRSPVVFNELGNGSGDSNDWLEFRNVTGAAVSLKDWELSVVQNGEKKDTSLIVFTDVSVPANGLLLITNSDPTADGNRLAGGDNAATSEVETKGSSHLYLVNSGLALPDDGKFLLILRKSKEKLGMNEAFVDVAGGGGSDTDAFIREQAGEYDTHVWPLQVREAPGADTEDALGSGKVWQRAKADIVGYHKDAWGEAAFTGIGYDRAVSKSAATAGTPGYPNGALKTEASTPKGSITISEVMFDSGGGKLPQWVELYNKSKTEAINLNRWRLELQNVNSEDLVGRPIVTLTLGEKVIQPNQTLLIVSGDARASASARLPADRVYNLFKLHEKNLRLKKPQDTFLSAVGFYLKLSDRNGTKIDEVGNTDGNRRTDDAPSWALPVSPEEGVRSSLIRRYTKGTSVAEDGMERGGWVLASNVKRFVADKELHWGHADDIGTPGYRAGGPLPVELSSFSVKRTEAGAVVLTWTTESEVDNAGFNLRRSEKRDSGFTLLNPALIAGAGTTGERQAYTWTDTSAKPGVEYYYRIEEVAFDGGPVTLVTRFLPGPVSASNRMLTTFGAVKSRD